MKPAEPTVRCAAVSAMIISESSVTLVSRFESRQSMLDSVRVERLPSARDNASTPPATSRPSAGGAAAPPPWAQAGPGLSQPTAALEADLDRAADTLGRFAAMAARFPAPLAGGADATAAPPTAGRASRSASAELDSNELGLRDAIEFSLLKALVERWSGKRVALFVMRDQPASVATPPSAAIDAAQGAAPSPAQPAPGWRAERYTRIEAEQSVSLSASASVRTSDGREISIELELTMRSSFYSETRTAWESGGVLKDPLVINLDRPAAALGDTRFSFDLDADGVAEQLATLESGSAFLALDRNGNGTIDDGSELFGALSGDGFAELAALDEDGNGWIDAGDSVFSKLRVWAPSADGEQRLLALADLDVGALYLGRVNTPFDLRDSAQQLQGVIRDTGFYLKESGGAGTLQQIDLVV